MRNLETRLLKNKKMDSDVYALRRKVIEIIYRLKKDIELPRIEVRITDSHSRILGVAKMEKNVIWITEGCINSSPALLLHVVAHEIGHAVYGLPHNDKCPLMKPSVTERTAATYAQALKVLRKAL